MYIFVCVDSLNLYEEITWQQQQCETYSVDFPYYAYNLSFLARFHYQVSWCGLNRLICFLRKNISTGMCSEQINLVKD